VSVCPEGESRQDAGLIGANGRKTGISRQLIDCVIPWNKLNKQFDSLTVGTQTKYSDLLF